MKPFRIRELQMTDVQALLAFEIHNREWFESQIDARDPAFYSWTGVTEHIEGYLADFAVGVWHPFVIEDGSGRIVGRANLKDIHPADGYAQVGYRIDQDFCRQGLATLALEHLIRQARMRWALTQLVAYVYEQNVGSRKVLERCGFVAAPRLPGEEAGEGCRFVLAVQAAARLS
ncbi:MULTISPECIES: GNAT family N-acetyltransferase [unclassified Pseudomonas]|uniref:GNAT family N-acetyltransferase n=1 Tax=unclassified Pseudomonas TaxID=196821 RepID=UPI0008713BFD|nr:MULTISPECIES: GNAT family N-acetyltransferase [unclassified Pseudomonas]SCW67335.1 ribosomal-protein-alanine N-acetyltransferase [Pseudomonas sp. NFACC56-3]SFK32579.1 ribosomal-protein-alanine N-acetyltransferase [Pseudomonas sp. NFACC52]